MSKPAFFILLLMMLLLVCGENVGPRTGSPSNSSVGMENKYRLMAVSAGPSVGRIFTWRNYFRSSPAIEQQSDAPLVIRKPRFYSYWSWGYGIGTMLNYDLVNVSQKPIHSFTTSERSAEPGGAGASGSQPETALKPGESMPTKISVSGKRMLTLTVDFVQFDDGTTWHSNDGQKFVHPDGVRAGARDAAQHLIKVLESSGPEAVVNALPRIHADVRDDMRTFDVWGFGHYCGVTNVSVKVRYANREGGLKAIEDALRRILDDAQVARRPPNGVPVIRLDKSRFALGESVFFWVGVEATSRDPIPKEYQNTCRLIITRPDGTSKMEPNSWPADGMVDRGWLGGASIGSSETQLGRYTLVFEFAGQRTEPVSLLVEDLPILKQIEAEFVFSHSRDGLAAPDGNVILTVRNNSDQILRFPQPGGDNSMVSVSLSKSDRSYRNDFFYPSESLPGLGKTSGISFDTFTWDVASQTPSITIRPGETYRQEMPLRAALAEAAKGSSVRPGRYDVAFSTTLQILIGEKDGKWSEISPVRIPVSATAACVIDR
jgi:hypothetical protein